MTASDGVRRGAGVRWVQRVSSTPLFAKIAPRALPAVDRTIHRLTRGRVLPSAWLLPGVVLTVPGARTGSPRSVPLACMPEESGSWILIGSNFGRTDHPAWTVNLLHHPQAVVNWRGEDIPVRARLLEGEEREDVWARVLAFWPPYATYQARVSRTIRVFRLTRC
ncbi:nitroreductase family deazaflavin-dependent oxidoreductase [Streptomyces sp. NPDC005953]|uniref:nitroreductase family deazaflavin-dependent oxidoreductase n=1 Tax=unclassified Streptomyces TaxID=2593676 RepID=UPI0033D8D593